MLRKNENIVVGVVSFVLVCRGLLAESRAWRGSFSSL